MLLSYSVVLAACSLLVGSANAAASQTFTWKNVKIGGKFKFRGSFNLANVSQEEEGSSQGLSSTHLSKVLHLLELT